MTRNELVMLGKLERKALAMQENMIREFVEKHQAQWARDGALLRAWREKLGMTVYAVAKEIAVSDKRLRRLENGECVKDAALLKRAYALCLQFHQAHVVNEQLSLENLKLRESQPKFTTMSNVYRKRVII